MNNLNNQSNDFRTNLFSGNTTDGISKQVGEQKRIESTCKQQKNTKKMKGITNNPNGRPKGSVNKSTAELREMITTLFESKYEDFTNAFDGLEPKEKVDAYIKLMSFILPKQRDVDLKVSEFREQPFFELPDIDVPINSRNN